MTKYDMAYPSMFVVVEFPSVDDDTLGKCDARMDQDPC